VVGLGVKVDDEVMGRVGICEIFEVDLVVFVISFLIEVKTVVGVVV